MDGDNIDDVSEHSVDSLSDDMISPCGLPNDYSYSPSSHLDVKKSYEDGRFVLPSSMSHLPHYPLPSSSLQNVSLPNSPHTHSTIPHPVSSFPLDLMHHPWSYSSSFINRAIFGLNGKS